MENYPGNSQSNKTPESKPARETLQKVVDGPVTRRKTPLGTRFKNIFIADDAKGVAGFILQDILIPKGKEMVVDAISQGAERTFYGEVRRALGNKAGSSGYTSYSRYSSPSTQQHTSRPEPRQSMMSRTARARHDFGEIVIPTRAEADMVIERLFDLVNSEYRSASVADLYDLVGITGDFTDNKWGWTNLADAGVQAVRGGYLLILPRPEPLD